MSRAPDLISTPQRRYGALSDMLSGVTLLQTRPDDARGDFFIDLSEPANGLFCRRWTVRDIAGTFLEAGCLEHWKSHGYTKLWIELWPARVDHRYEMSVWTQASDRSELLMLIVVWLEYTRFDRLNASYPSFYVEHLRLQLPGRPFARAALPGQDFASSGMLRRIFGVIRKWACELGAGVITEIPEYFHTACLFGEYFVFVDAEMEMLFRAMKRDLMTPGTSLASVSEAFENGQIRFRDKTWLWPTEMQAFGLSHELNSALHLEPDIRDIPQFTRITQ